MSLPRPVRPALSRAVAMAAAAAALGLAAAGAARAQDPAASAEAEEALRLAATAPPGCVLGTASGRAGANAAFAPDGRGGGAITITELVDPASAQARPARMVLALPVVCNAAHRVVVASGSGALRRANSAQSGGQRPARGGFEDQLPYRMAIDWGGRQIALRSEDRAATGSFGPVRGDLELTIDTLDDKRLLTAGAYDDTITIRFEPGS